jgi:hypothetical protein
VVIGSRVDDPTLSALLDPWASPRLRRWGASELAVDRGATCSAIELTELLARAGIPAWPRLLALEERFGGLKIGSKTLGLYAWLRQGRPLCTSGGMARMSPTGALWDPIEERDLGADDAGSWIVLVQDIDLDTGFYAGEEGLVYLALSVNGKAFPVATGVELYLEKRSLGDEIVAARRASDTGDFFVEVDGEVGDALASDAGVPAVPEASDAVSRFWWDGALAIQQGVRFGEPTARSTRVDGAALDRVRAAAARAHQLAGGSVRVIGWPNAHTYEFARALANDRGLPVETVTTYP